METGLSSPDSGDRSAVLAPLARPAISEIPGAPSEWGSGSGSAESGLVKVLSGVSGGRLTLTDD